jgi:signal transduction histidine kinase
VQPTPSRLIATAAACSIVLAIVGFAWDAGRFGLTDASSASRLEREVRRLVDNRARDVRVLAERVSSEGAAVERAAASRDGLPALFDLLTDRAQTTGSGNVSVTVYVPAGPKGAYRVVAWSDGPADEVVTDRLNGPAALFVAPGSVGLRLVYAKAIEWNGRRVGVAAAETILSPSPGVGTFAFTLDTSFGPVTLIPRPYTGASQTGSTSFLISSPSEPLIEVHYSMAALSATRQLFHRRVAAAAVTPFILVGLMLTGRLIAERTRARRAGPFLAWSLITLGVVAAGAAALIGVISLAEMPARVSDEITALAWLAAAALVPVSLWWRAGSRHSPSKQLVRFAIEQLAGGVVMATVLLVITATLRGRITPTTLSTWAFPVFPFDTAGLLYLSTLVVIEIAAMWAIAGVLAALATRWRLTWRRPAVGAGAALLWLVAPVAVLVTPHALQPLPAAGWASAGLAAVVFALVSTSLRRAYRRMAQAMRLVLLFCSLFLPIVALYPTALFYADRTARAVVAEEYAPALANHPHTVRAALQQATREIDGVTNMPSLVGTAEPGAVDTRVAFTVWRGTSLSRARVTSDIELYGRDRNSTYRLVSRFALNIPEYVYGENQSTWQGTGCRWTTYDDVRRFGATMRPTIHAERGICDTNGELIGAVVVNVFTDYRALPFVSPANPYADVLQTPESQPRETRLADLEVVVYGWSLQPTFPYGDIAWPITPALFDAVYHSRAPFWQTQEAGDRRYHVYFSNDSTGIYAIGYPVATAFEHATRLAEAGTLTAAIFIILLLGAAVYGPIARRRDAPLRVLFHEIRTSFYRKLFLFFVLAAVGPVVMLALAFGAYMTAKFQADVQSEAANVVTVARRVLEELAAAELHPDQQQPLPTDDVMVWIGQVIDQDVNLYEGSQLVATSQRDLFDSGLLPTRTPASAFRHIVLDRLPTFVAKDRLGTFEYLVAAAPVARGRDAVISVPLAPRQREIEQEIDKLNRGVLVGAGVLLLFAAGLGASVAGRISDPVARLTRATRQIAAGRLDVRIVADTADELRRLVDDFNSMAATLDAQRTALARTNQLKAWNEMARQVAHEIKNPLTPIQLAAEHLQRVHEDEGRPLGAVFDQCLTTVLRQVKLLRQIAAEFANFAGEQKPRPVSVPVADLVEDVVRPYRAGFGPRHSVVVSVPPDVPAIWVDRTLISRALTNVIENAVQAMPEGGRISIAAARDGTDVRLTVTDTGVGMDAESVRRAFEPYFSTKTAGSGLGLVNARRNVELCGGTMALESAPGKGTVVTLTLPVESRPAAS